MNLIQKTIMSMQSSQRISQWGENVNFRKKLSNNFYHSQNKFHNFSYPFEKKTDKRFLDLIFQKKPKNKVSLYVENFDFRKNFLLFELYNSAISVKNQIFVNQEFHK